MTSPSAPEFTEDIEAVRARCLDALADTPMIVAVMSGKGGVGKSCVAVNLATAFAKPGGFPDPVAKEVQFRPAYDAGPFDLDLGDPRRVDGKLAFHARALDDPADGEHLAAARSASGDHHSGEQLDAFLLAFENSAMHVDRVANLEFWPLVFDAGLLGQLH